MIRAYLNKIELKLFPEIAMGITIENFNISDIPNRRIDRTNSIKVPKAGNEAAFEFSSIPNAPTDFMYNAYSFDLVVDGIKIYENGRAFITGEDEKSYTLNITNNKNIIDLLKSINLATLYESDTVNLITTTTWFYLFYQKRNGFRIDYFFDADDTPTLNEYRFRTWEKYLSIYIDTIFTKIEADYDITFSGNLLTNADFLEMRIPMVSSNLKRDNGTLDIYVDDIVIHDSLTAWDLIKSVLQLFCGVFKINGTDMELQKFDDLDVTTPVDWSGKLVSKTKKFSVPDTAQKNFIKYASADNVDKDQNSTVIECNNLNLPYEKDLTTMKVKLLPYLNMNQYYTNASVDPLLFMEMPILEMVFPGLPTDPTPEKVKGIKDLLIFVDSAEYIGATLAIWLYYYHEVTLVPHVWEIASFNGSLIDDADTTIVKYYDFSGNYSLIETMLTDPVFYETELLLNIIDIYEFDHFKAVKIDELEGVFYVNRISNFLATKPGVPTKVELIKIS